MEKIVRPGSSVSLGLTSSVPFVFLPQRSGSHSYIPSLPPICVQDFLGGQCHPAPMVFFVSESLVPSGRTTGAYGLGTGVCVPSGAGVGPGGPRRLGRILVLVSTPVPLHRLSLRVMVPPLSPSLSLGTDGPWTRRVEEADVPEVLGLLGSRRLSGIGPRVATSTESRARRVVAKGY